MAEITEPELASSLAAGCLTLDYGACRLRIRSRLAAMPAYLRTVYGAFPFQDDEPFADFHIEIARGRGLRAFVRPQSRFRIDGFQPFEPFPASAALAHFEWGVNWSIARRFNQFLLLHAGVVAHGDDAILMAAVPGSGKSTLSAALMLNGWRLLSDEFGVFDPRSGRVLSMLKPVALKNESIEVIRRFSDRAVLGPLFSGTRKGDVAHLAPDARSVAERHDQIFPRVVVFPRYSAGAALSVKHLEPQQGFARLAFNSFNYSLLGAIGFDAVADIMDRCPAFELEYGSLETVVEFMDTLLRDVEVECASSV